MDAELVWCEKVEARTLQLVLRLVVLRLLRETITLALDPLPFAAVLEPVTRWLWPLAQAYPLPVDLASLRHAPLQTVVVPPLLRLAPRVACFFEHLPHRLGARPLSVRLTQSRFAALRRHAVLVSDLVVLLAWVLAVLAARLVVARLRPRAAHARSRAVAAVKLARVVLSLSRSLTVVFEQPPPERPKELRPGAGHLLLTTSSVYGPMRH